MARKISHATNTAQAHETISDTARLLNDAAMTTFATCASFPAA
jgi:hypothetical protein